MTKQSTAGHTELPVRIYVWGGAGSGWNDRLILNEVRTKTYYRADAVTELVEALEACQASLALMIEPKAIKSSSVMGAFTQAFEADCKARSALTHYRELAGTSNEGAK